MTINKNAVRYHFSDFTTAHYRELLKLAKSKYTFRSYLSFNKSERFILWRHDIDFSPQRAQRLAEIEASEDVPATYFLHLQSVFYNVFENETAKKSERSLNWAIPSVFILIAKIE